jgi:type II secretory pathway pseudopilin PulG
MRRSPVSNQLDRGFTLLENLTIVLILGIAMAIGTPSLLAMQQRQRLIVATDMVLAALREAQQTAIEHSSVCSIQIASTAITDKTNCLKGGNIALPNGITMSSPGLDNSIEYGMKGNTTDNRTIRLTSNGSTTGKCITVSAPLGITRQGSYSKPTQPCQSKKS